MHDDTFWVALNRRQLRNLQAALRLANQTRDLFEAMPHFSEQDSAGFDVSYGRMGIEELSKRLDPEGEHARILPWVVIVQGPGEGSTLYGPFASNEVARRWAACDPVTDLEGQPWTTMQLWRIREE